MENRIFSIDHHGEKYAVATAFRQRGEEMLLLLHGLGCAKESYKEIWLREEFDDYSILALDLIGFGASAKPNEFSYSMEDQAHICSEVVRQIHPEKVHIVAHSMGGAIGLLLPSWLLDAALSFANLEGNLGREDCGIVSQRTAAVSFQQFETEVLPELKALSRSFGRERFFLESSLPLGFYKSAESLVRWSDSGDLLSRFDNLSCRKAYFYGQENADALALYRLESIEKIMIIDSGHFLMNDNPGEFYPRLSQFLRLP